MSRIKVVGLDPSVTNFGICEAFVDVDTGDFDVISLKLVKTSSNPDGRRSMDDRRRCVEIAQQLRKSLVGAAWCIYEVPQIGGANMQARSIWSSGMMFGLLASFDGVDPVEVTPIEVKMAAVGRKDATKSDMIDWAVAKFPEAEWLRKTIKGETSLIKDNEHLADAVAVVNAGLKTPLLVQALNAIRKINNMGGG